MRYITETKNLFDINSAVKVSGLSSFSKNGNQITVSQNFIGTYISANVLLDTSFVGKTISLTALAMTSGLNNTYIRIQWLANDGLAGGREIHSNIITGNSFQKLTLTGVVPESPGGDFNNLCIMFYSNVTSSLETGVTYSATFTNIQLELGDTATPYVPYGYLPMRRMKYKVSNVCQLLDKRTYPATGTRNGITFTHNGDGSYTANGTFASSDGSYFYFITNEHKNTITLLANHKYLVLNGAYYEAGTYSVWMVVNNQLVAESNGTLFGNDFNAKCYTPKNDEEAALSMRIVHKTNADTINFTFKPQLFDLTEMYGAGSEPTTVEEFRADFPDDLYEYTPRCWASMKNIRYLEKTKNLFDYSKVNNLMYIGGYSVNQYFIKNGNRFTVTYPMSKGATYLDYIMPLKAGTYTLSLLAYGTVSGATKGYFGLVKVENDYKVLKYNKYAKSWLSGNDRQSYTLTIEEDGNYAVYAYSDYANSTNLDSTFWDIQLELGDTATDYVPYGYLPLK